MSPNARLAAGECMSASLTLGAVTYGLQLAIEGPK
jgi:hypothetical protein